MLIGRVPTSGGAEEVIASGLNWPVSIAVDSTNLYWTSINDNTVVAQSLSSGARQTLATEQYFPIDIAVLDSQTVYWSACTTSAGTLCDFWSLPVGGGSPTSLYSFTTGGNPVLSVLSPNLYAAVPGQAILSFAIAPGGTSATLDTGSYWDVTAGQGWVAWYSAETSQGASNGLLKTGSVGSSIVVASGNPEAIAVDGNNVYWANANDGNVFLGTLATVPVLGGSPSVLVAGVSTFHMVVDESNVYWLGFDATTSGVFRTAK